jgi:pyruvate dehydrogenase E2 component (dihydrolipoamide acetyltransferase)
MTTEFVMPKLGLTMEQGRIVEWLVADGDPVVKGMAVLRIETDKVESDVESPGAGRLHRSGTIGEVYPCGSVIGWLLADGETPPSSTAPASGTAASTVPTAAPSTSASARIVAGPLPDDGRRPISPNARRVAAELGVDLSRVTGTGPGARVVSEDVRAAASVVTPAAATAASASAGPSPDAGVPATAAARQLADLLGIDLRLVERDPFDGRVTRESVARYVRQRLARDVSTEPTPPRQPTSTPVVTSTAPAPAPVAKGPAGLPEPMQVPSEIRKLTGMRGTIAKRMHAALQDMAQLTLMMDADLEAVVADRAERQQGSARVPSFTDYVIAATARALRAHPIVNAQVIDAGIALLPEINVGFAVAVPNGLMVPVVRRADTLGLVELASETARLAEAGRAGQLKLADLEGGTFSVSALGMFGVDGFTPVINPPNVAILGVGRLRDDVVLRNDAVTTTKRLTLSLTWDHRVLDGAPAAQFCQSIVAALADPRALAGAGR